MATPTYIGTVTANGTGGSSITLSSVATGGADFYELILGSRNNNTTLGTITVTVNGSSANLTALGNVLSTGGRAGTWAFGYTAPTTGNVVFSWSGTQDSTRISVGVKKWSGVDQSTPVGTVATFQSEVSTAPAVNVTSVAGDAVSCSIFWAGGTNITPNGTQTERFDQNADIGTLENSDIVAVGTTTNVGGTVSGADDTALVAYAIKGASGGGGRTFFLSSGLDGISSSGPKQFNPSLG